MKPGSFTLKAVPFWISRFQAKQFNFGSAYLRFWPQGFAAFSGDFTLEYPIFCDVDSKHVKTEEDLGYIIEMKQRFTLALGRWYCEGNCNDDTVAIALGREHIEEPDFAVES
jgi:hypothetical protein